ncbi:MAG: hypothetical protein D6791_17780 [Chloroflexi bacterium]|nr:MAG: hypothetical protein D6791_17780 [Chloroflexota bacterium]
MLHSIDGVRQRLEVERERLTEDIQRLTAVHYGRSSYSNHPADSATDVSVDAMNGALLQIRSRHLEMVENALRRLEDGTYGICEGCGREIDPARLEVLPEAHLCVECQARLG